MSNDTPNTPSKVGKGLRIARFCLMFPAIFVVWMVGSFFGVADQGFYSATTLMRGADIARVTDTTTLTAYRKQPCVSTAQDPCGFFEGVFGTNTLVQEPAVSVTWVDNGENEVLYNVDFFQFYKPDSNTVAADANALQRQGSRGENDMAVVIPTGVRIPLFNRMWEGGINRSIIRLTEYVPAEEYAQLTPERQAQVMTGNIGHFSFPTAVWIGVAWGMFWLVQMLCMCLPFVQFSLRGKANWGWMLGPVGAGIVAVVRRFRRRASAA